MAYKGFNPVAFARTAATTLAHHIRDVEENMLRNYQLGALLEAAGRVNYNNTGEGFDWPVQYRLHKIEGNTGETDHLLRNSLQPLPVCLCLLAISASILTGYH